MLACGNSAQATSRTGLLQFCSQRYTERMKGDRHTFTVVLEPAEEGGFVVTVPALPEVGTQGDSYDEAMANAREAIELVIEERLARGQPIPADVQPKIERITVAA
jgi:predicted RNase H-like HicB family nuclease